MKTKITYQDIMELNPCYDPKELGPIDTTASMTIPEFITEYRDKVKNKDDIIWVLCREEYMTDRDMRLFAVWCAREALKLIDNPDPRSVEVCNVAERFANGGATKKELDAAGAAAWAAAWDTAWAAAWDTAWDAAWGAAWAAAGDAARGAARDAARDAQMTQLLTYFQTS